MAYDNEQWLAAPWKPEYGRRIFKNDMFLSYRHSDAPATGRLADLLRNADVAVWWDEVEDLGDRRVLEKIGHVIFHSRYIVACVSSASTLSEWMQAELARAVSAGREWNYTRVAVALLDEHAIVPERLIGCPKFAIWNGQASTLAEFVKAGNRFDFLPEDSREAISKEFLENPGIHPTKSENAEINHIEGLLGLPWEINISDLNEFEYALQSLRRWVTRFDRRDLDSVPDSPPRCYGPAVVQRSPRPRIIAQMRLERSLDWPNSAIRRRDGMIVALMQILLQSTQTRQSKHLQH